MIRPVLVLVGLSAAFLMVNSMVGYHQVYGVLYGAFALMAIMVSLTFLWLWVRRATPLASGMFFGWAGAAGVMGWWWSYNQFENPSWMIENPFLFVLLALYFVGAILHFQVIWQSFGIKSRTYLAPVVGSVVVSVLLQLTL